MGLSHQRGLFHDDLRNKWGYNIVFLIGLLFIVAFSFLTTPVPGRIVASIILLLFGLELLPYRTDRSPAATWLQIGSYMGSAGTLLWILSSLDKYAWLYVTGESLIYFGFLLPVFIGITGLTGESKIFKFPLIPDRQNGLFRPGPVSLYLFIATFLTELIIRFTMRKTPPLPITGGIRLLVFIYWVFISGALKTVFTKSSTEGIFWKISLAMVVLGLFGYIIGVDYRSHYSHLFYIGGLGLALLLVLPFNSPQKKNILFAGSALLLVAVGRSFAIPSSSGYSNQIGGLALLLLLVVLLYLFRERHTITKE
jgi:hypothetical protein